MQVLADMIGSDHLPIVGKFLLSPVGCIQNQVINTNNVANDLYIDWDNLNSQQMYSISKNAYQLEGSFRNNNEYNCVSPVYKMKIARKRYI